MEAVPYRRFLHIHHSPVTLKLIKTSAQRRNFGWIPQKVPQSISTTGEVKYLGIILDSKLASNQRFKIEMNRFKMFLAVGWRKFGNKGSWNTRCSNSMTPVSRIVVKIKQKYSFLSKDFSWKIFISSTQLVKS